VEILMRRVPSILAALALLGSLALGSCFSRPSTKCSFLCGDGTVCPEDYECGTDDRCHLVLDIGELAVCDPDDIVPDAGGGGGLDSGSPVDAGATLDAP
jgi:hypothetical protein